MRKSRVFDYVCLLFFLFVASKVIKLNIGSFYNGIPFHGNAMFYVVYLLLYFAFAIHIFGDSEQYFSNYGIYTLIRYRKKSVVYRKYLLLMIQKIIIYDIFKVIFCILLSKVSFGKLDIDTKNILIFFTLNLFIDFILATMQTVFEIMLDSRRALCILGGYYIISLTAVDIMYYYDLKKIPFFFFLNWGMEYRFDAMRERYFVVMMCLILLLAGWIIIGNRVTEKKDFL